MAREQHKTTRRTFLFLYRESGADFGLFGIASLLGLRSLIERSGVDCVVTTQVGRPTVKAVYWNVPMHPAVTLPIECAEISGTFPTRESNKRLVYSAGIFLVGDER
jgi:hypothetical protein